LSYKVLLISSGQPSLNPRLVKEADTLADAGFTVTVLYAYWNAWGTTLDIPLLASKKWQAIRVGGSPGHKPFIYFLSRLLFKCAGIFTRLTGVMLFADIAIARSNLFLINEAKKHKANIYIGHNLGALPATVKAAKKHDKPCGFDAEDFHRNEVTNNAESIAVKLSSYIEDTYMPQLQYLTASSPLIGQAYQNLYDSLKVETILNTFPKQSIKTSTQKTTVPIKLFWFSQTIGTGRGIEDILAALALQANSFELHLLGDASDEIQVLFSAKISSTISKVFFHKPIPSDDIIAFAAQFDIGIASEKSTPLNRDICLTNKLFTYIQAGLTVIASNTRAQTALMQQNGVAGELYDDTEALLNTLLFYKNNPEVLQQHKTHNYQLGQTTLNWDTDRVRFLSIVNKTLAID
jgi:glycosyltransferase involved in cell wall biosynthesis